MQEEQVIKKERKKRKAGWRIDAKWICGIIFTLLLIPNLLVLNLYQATSYKSAEKVLTPLIEDVFGLKELVKNYYNNIIELAKNHPDQDITIPYSELKIPIKGSEISTLSSDELSKYISQKLVTQIYKSGVGEIITGLPRNIEIGGFENIPIQNLQFAFNIYSKKTHNMIQILLLIFSTLSFVFLIPFSLFSFRFGKLESLGISSILVSAPFFILFIFIRLTTSANITNKTDPISYFANNAIYNFSEIAVRNYLISLSAGFVFLILGILAGGIYWIVKR